MLQEWTKTAFKDLFFIVSDAMTLETRLVGAQLRDIKITNGSTVSTYFCW